MTERSARHCHRDSSNFVVGPSRLDWDGQCLHMRLNEVTVPWFQKISGHIRLWPQSLSPYSVALDAAGRHRWGPLAPMGRIEVDLPEPGLKWSGQAYLDSNEGDEPIEDGFTLWDWSRTHLPDGSTEVTYDMHGGTDPDRLLRLRFAPDGQVENLPPVPVQKLPRTAWRIGRRARAHDQPVVHQQLEDTPFYQRSLLARPGLGADVHTFHETLSVPRFVSPAVQGMLPWRMPRRR
jgi:carotenoid 1,2-hydratase